MDTPFKTFVVTGCMIAAWWYFSSNAKSAEVQTFCSYPMNAVEFRMKLSADEERIDLYMNGKKLQDYRLTGNWGNVNPASYYMVSNVADADEAVMYRMANGGMMFERMLFGDCEEDFKPVAINWLKSPKG